MKCSDGSAMKSGMTLLLFFASCLLPVLPQVVPACERKHTAAHPEANTPELDPLFARVTREEGVAKLK